MPNGFYHRLCIDVFHQVFRLRYLLFKVDLINILPALVMPCSYIGNNGVRIQQMTELPNETSASLQNDHLLY